MTHSVTKLVYAYVEQRIKDETLIWPNTTEDAILFAQTEIAEAVEILFARKEYIRNHPDDKPDWSAGAFGEELGDAIFMLMVAGYMMGCDPIDSMISKWRNDARADPK